MRSKWFIVALAAVFLVISFALGSVGLGDFPLLRWGSMLLVPVIAVVALLVLGRKSRGRGDDADGR